MAEESDKWTRAICGERCRSIETRKEEVDYSGLEIDD